MGRSPISSRKSVPPLAASNLPSRRWSAPVKAPFSWPKSSEAISDSGIAAQLTQMNGRFARLDLRHRARAISSLPVPVVHVDCRHVPADDLAICVFERVVLKELPAILPVLQQQA